MSMRQEAGAGENSPSHPLKLPHPSGLTGGPTRLRCWVQGARHLLCRFRSRCGKGHRE